jgi:hypothetical protein
MQQPPQGYPPQQYPQHAQPPAPKQGMSVGAKILIAIGAVCVLGVGSCVMCVGLGAIGAKAAADKAAAKATSSGAAPGATPAATAEPERAPATPVAIETLLADYHGNEVRADGLYKGKRLQVTGVVGDIKKDILDKIYVTLGTGKTFETPVVQAFFDDEHTAAVSTLNKGSKLQVECTCGGLMMNVLMNDCAIVDLVKVDAVGEMATCHQLETAGVAANCQSLNKAVQFDIPSPSKGHGTVFRFVEAAVYQKAVAGFDAKTVNQTFLSAKTRTVVFLPDGAPPDLRAKTKAVVDGL